MHLARRPDYFRATRADEAAAWFRDLLDKPTTAAWVAEEAGRRSGSYSPSSRAAENPFRRERDGARSIKSRWIRRGAAAASAGTHGRRPRGGARRGVRDVELSSWAFNTDAHALFRRSASAARRGLRAARALTLGRSGSTQ